VKLTCYIIDDEPLAIEVLETHLEKIDQIEIANTFQNAVKAFQALQEQPVDLLFLDIQMPDLTGITLLKTLKNPPDVIFTTAYQEYALEGYELDVTDYLLKPISFERFLKAINKVFDQRRFARRPVDDRPAEESGLFVQINKKMVKIQPEEILFIESQRDYVKIKTTQKELIVHQTISYLEEQLPSDRFLRIHRSFIVSLFKIESWSSNEIELLSKKIPIGRTYKSAVLKRLEERSNFL
jgi:DNA-binding LytR/AlgR family response regulator